ncbi:hypothetical protein [Rhodoferax mekongensis]|uniref:hypothetical protein n=1 Tax=Rhodoferax mekongensis TaxID=3068341 RepID=UPI0028BD4DC8|nr:hypothetical protein [Rhodoferax sp. TBRC 17199]MDT7516048.1 hypothetical protein [Rhodoferax sp. TBRC 17199]
MNRKEKIPADANAETESIPKPPYISFGKEESEAIWTLDPRCMWLYFRLKWLGNFKTGRVGTFKNQKLTLEGLARMVAIPVRQGMTPGNTNIDGTEIRRLLQRLRDVGLVADGESDQTRLTMTLPMSPIRKKAVGAEEKPQVNQVRNKAVSTPESISPRTLEPWEKLLLKDLDDADITASKLPILAEKLPTAEDVESTENPHEDWGSDDSDLSPSVLTNSNTNHYFSVLEAGEAQASPNTGGACGTHAPPPPPERRPLVEGFESAEGMMGELEIVIALNAVKNPPVLFVEHQNSRQYLQNMEALGIKEQELAETIERLQMDRTIPLTPSAILHELRRAKAPKQMPFARGNVSKIPRSRVAL